jgi:GxxExxY protein
MEVNYKYSDLSKTIIGLSMKVHTLLGLGFPEVVCKRALIIELKKAGLLFLVEKEQDIFYGDEWVGTRRVDILV